MAIPIASPLSQKTPGPCVNRLSFLTVVRLNLSRPEPRWGTSPLGPPPPPPTITGRAGGFVRGEGARSLWGRNSLLCLTTSQPPPPSHIVRNVGGEGAGEGARLHTGLHCQTYRNTIYIYMFKSHLSGVPNFIHVKTYAILNQKYTATRGCPRGDTQVAQEHIFA